MWYFLTNESILQQYPADKLWKFVPMAWRPWWIDSLKENVHQYRTDSITFHHPSPYFVDRTFDIDDYKDRINKYELPELISSTDEHLLATVLCPWGCSDFIHKSLPLNVGLDVVIQRYLRKVVMKSVNDQNKFKFIESCRDDFLLNDPFSICLHPEWKVMPTIKYVEGKGPTLLACRHHGQGTVNKWIHQPREPDNILSDTISDQLPNVNANLSHLRKEGVLSDSFVIQIRDYAKTLHPNASDLEDEIAGATYVPLEDAILLE